MAMMAMMAMMAIMARELWAGEGNGGLYIGAWGAGRVIWPTRSNKFIYPVLKVALEKALTAQRLTSCQSWWDGSRSCLRQVCPAPQPSQVSSLKMSQSSNLTLQMFVSEDEWDLFLLVSMVYGVYLNYRVLTNYFLSFLFPRVSPPKNDFYRILLSRDFVLDPLSFVPNIVLDEEAEQAKISGGRIANIFYIFSQAENHVIELESINTNWVDITSSYS